MNHPHKLPALLCAGLMSLTLCAPALAGHSDATVEIVNHFDGPAEVWLDGRLQGVVPGDGRLRVDSRPGHRSLVVRRPDTGFVLRSTHLHLSPRHRTLVTVDPPLSTLRLRNPSETALRVTAGPHDLWLSPRTSVELTVRAGHVSLVATTPGDHRVHDRRVWVEPGRSSLTVLDYEPLPRFRHVEVVTCPVTGQPIRVASR